MLFHKILKSKMKKLTVSIYGNLIFYGYISFLLSRHSVVNLCVRKLEISALPKKFCHIEEKMIKKRASVMFRCKFLVRRLLKSYTFYNISFLYQELFLIRFDIKNFGWDRSWSNMQSHLPRQPTSESYLRRFHIFLYAGLKNL